MTRHNKIEIIFPNGSASVEWLGETLTRVGENRYRFEVDPLSCLYVDSERELTRLPQYQDEFEAETISENRIRFKKVLKRAPLKRYSWVIWKEIAESTKLEEFFVKISSEGGYWERIFGGIMTVYMPKDSKMNIENEFSLLLYNDIRND